MRFDVISQKNRDIRKQHPRKDQGKPHPSYVLAARGPIRQWCIGDGFWWVEIVLALAHLPGLQLMILAFIIDADN